MAISAILKCSLIPPTKKKSFKLGLLDNHFYLPYCHAAITQTSSKLCSWFG